MWPGETKKRTAYRVWFGNEVVERPCSTLLWCNTCICTGSEFSAVSNVLSSANSTTIVPRDGASQCDSENVSSKWCDSWNTVTRLLSCNDNRYFYISISIFFLYPVWTCHKAHKAIGDGTNRSTDHEWTAYRATFFSF